MTWLVCLVIELMWDEYFLFEIEKSNVYCYSHFFLCLHFHDNTLSLCCMQGKSTMLKIMAGLDKEFEGTARPLPGASIGYLSQEPQLEFETVQECVDDAVKSSQAILDQYNEESMKLADPDLDDDQMAAVMTKVEQLNNQIEAGDLWDLDRVVSRAMDALRVPAGDAKTAVLSGGEKRRVALCRLLLSNHDMLLLGKCNHVYCKTLMILCIRRPD